VIEALPGGGQIKLISAPVFIATKLEAFRDRGQGDYLASHDLEDIVTVIDGRPDIVAEIKSAPSAVGVYLKESLGGLLQQQAFVQAIEGHLPA
jgi:hypothetical protein